MIVDTESALDMAVELCVNQHEYTKALELACRSYQLEPNYDKSCGVYGALLQINGFYKEAVKVLTQGMAVATDEKRYAAIRFDRSLASLALGNYKDGFADFMYGIKAGARTPFQSEAPPWRGGRIEGKTLMITACEQGYGDSIMFSRFLKQAKEASGARIVFTVSDVLFGLLEGIEGYDAISSIVPPHDYQASVPSLPFLLGLDFEDIQGEPYITKYPLSTGGGVGICWQGNPEQQNDFYRSTKLEQWWEINSIPKGGVVSLQREHTFRDRCEGDIAYPEFKNFHELAQIIAGLDLVITVDTAVAHLAGAMGKETWLLLSSPPEWRWWGKENKAQPWYSVIKCYRQTRMGDWGPVFEKVASDLKERFS